MIARRLWTRSGTGLSGDGTRRGLAPDAFTVGTAMPDRREQPLAEIASHVHRESGMEEEASGDPAHVRALWSPTGR